MNIETFLEKELPRIHKQFQEGNIKSEDFLIAVNRYITHYKEVKKSPFHFTLNQHNPTNRHRHLDDDNIGFD